MDKVFWLYILALISITETFVFTMNRVSQQLAEHRSAAHEATISPVLERALARERASRQYIKGAYDPKLLEHSSFRGESLRFQNDFFSSQYMYLPESLEVLIEGVSGDVSIDKTRLVFEYHAQYRRKSKALIQSFVAAAQKKSQSYDRQVHDLLNCIDTSQEQFESFQNLRHDDLSDLKDASEAMIKAYLHNDYPKVFAVHQAYCDMSK